jgi:hypothetical protein
MVSITDGLVDELITHKQTQQQYQVPGTEEPSTIQKQYLMPSDNVISDFSLTVYPELRSCFKN